MKNAKLKLSVKSKYPEKDLSDRFLNSSIRGIGIIDSIKPTLVGRHISSQLFRSITSSGANYEEACAAESKPDFIHKLQIVLKELRETKYWLRLITEGGLLSKNQSNLIWISKETLELSNYC